MVYLFVTKSNTVEPYADKEEAQRLFGYGEPDMTITDKEYEEADGIIRLIDGKIFIGKTENEKREELALEKRKIRDERLIKTDKFMITDFPISEKNKKIIKDYRQELRDIPQREQFPFIEIPDIPVFNKEK